jgi:hypothetical protein
VYGSREGQGVERVPLDERLGLSAGDSSYVLEDRIQRFCLKGSFAEAAESLETILGLRSGPRTLEQMNQGLASFVVPFRDAVEPPPAIEEGPILVVTDDGKGVPMRRPVPEGRRRHHRRTKGEKADLDRLQTEGISEPMDRRFAQGEKAAAAARVLANVQVLKAQGRLVNPAGYIRAGIEQGYALLPAAARRLEAERRTEETAQRNAAAALARARAEAERQAEASAENAALATLEPARLEELVRRSLAELPPALTRRDPTVGNAFVPARVIELERARSPGAVR